MRASIVTLLLTIALPAFLFAEDSEIRSDIEVEVPLAEAVKAFNQKYPDKNPLTEEEVIAAVRTIKIEHPEIPDPVYKVYRQIIEKRVLPRGMYFSKNTGLRSGGYHFDVDWKDLTLTSLPQGHIDPLLGVHAFVYRIRARFISSRELTPDEKAEIEKQEAHHRKLKKVKTAKRERLNEVNARPR